MRIEKSLEGDHDSAGNAECGVNLMKGHVRTLKINLERRLRQRIGPEHPLMSWVVKFAASTYRRFHVGSDGRTPLERVTGRRCPGPVASIGEQVWWMALQPQGRPAAMDPRYRSGFFLGFSDTTQTHIIMTPQGMVRCRSV